MKRFVTTVVMAAILALGATAWAGPNVGQGEHGQRASKVLKNSPLQAPMRAAAHKDAKANKLAKAGECGTECKAMACCGCCK